MVAYKLQVVKHSRQHKLLFRLGHFHFSIFRGTMQILYLPTDPHEFTRILQVTSTWNR